ncbi:MAG: hypothetical protein ABI193_22780 [Minicystis sp.]
MATLASSLSLSLAWLLAPDASVEAPVEAVRMCSSRRSWPKIG